MCRRQYCSTARVKLTLACSLIEFREYSELAHNGRVIGGFREGRRECYMKRRGYYLCNRYELHRGVELY